MTDSQYIDSEEKRGHIRNYYAQLAQKVFSQTSGGCCSQDSDATSMIYDLPEVANLPEEIKILSAGCGDPVTLAELKAGQTVLDLGSGGGIDCFLAAEKVGPEGFVIGVDMTPEMIGKARANKARMEAENVEFRLGEIEHLPVADNRVDVVISNCVINLSTDKHQVFRETFRVLKSGGRLAVSDIVADGPLPPELADRPDAWSCCLAGAMDRQDYIRALEEAGFIEVEVTARGSDIEMTMEDLVEIGFDVATGVDEFEGKPIINVAGEWIAIESEGYRPPYSARITARKPQLS